MIRLAAISVAVLVSVTLQTPAAAQIRGRGAQLNRQEMVQRIQERFQRRIAQALQLDEEQREVLFDVFSSFSEARAELLPLRRELAARIREHLAADGSGDRAMELIEELRELRRREAELLLEEEDRLLEALSPSQVLRLQTMREQFGEQIRRLGSPSGPNANRRLGPGGPPGGRRP